MKSAGGKAVYMYRETRVVVLHLSEVSSCSVVINLRNNVLNFAVFTTVFEFKIGSRASTNIRCFMATINLRPQ